MSRLQFRNRHRRRGVTIVVVVAFLALGLSLGIAFLFKANNQAESMRKYREAAQGGRAAGVNTGSIGNNDESPPQPSDLFNVALGQLIYDVPDDESGYYNAIRGHSLARSMYGWNRTQPLGNTQAYNGFGRTHDPSWFSLINYQRMVGSNRDPEWESGNFIAKSAPYTYPDENNVFLAAVRSDGYVLVPSFHRPWLLTNPGGQGGTGAGDQFRQLRPRRNEQTPLVNTSLFPDMTPNPELGVASRNGSWGDVENLEGKNALFNGQRIRQYDSVWIDLDFPVRKWKGRNYKPLFAFLVVDLDSRVNANVAENLRGQNSTHTSNQGWGPWEVSINQILGGNAAGVLNSNQTPYRRYQTGAAPSKVFSLITPDNSPSTVPMSEATAFLATDAVAPFYSRVDFDASVVTGGAAPAATLYQYPLTQFYTSPTLSSRATNGSAAERNLHPLLYNPYFVPQLNRNAGGNGDIAFGARDMFYLNQKLNGETPVHYQTADMARVLPLTTSSVNLPNPRWLLTSISNDLQVAAMRPWHWPNLNGAPTYQENGVYPPVLPSGGAVGSPAPGANPTENPAGSRNSEFDANWRSLVAALGPIDLNRKLTDYRQDPAISFELNATNGTLNGPGSRAELDRQQLARDIFDRLAAATGARPLPTTPLPAANTNEYRALRRLAQMAVNIVDYIDNDDYMTRFDWLGNGTEVLWGTELPRLVINEAYVEAHNRGRIPQGKAVGFWEQSTPTDYRLWVELHNPLTPPGGSDANLSHGGGAPLVFNNNDVYRLKVLRDNTYDPQMRDETRFTGDYTPPAPAVAPVIAPLGNPNSVVLPSDPTAVPNPGFYLIGPGQLPGADNVQPTYTSAQMRIDQVAIDPNQGQQGLRPPPTILLQRLAFTHLPFDAQLNPYITVDYMIMPNGSVFDRREANGSMQPKTPDLNNARSFGRSQPYAAHESRRAAQIKNNIPANEIHHTFLQHNSNADNPFEWLVHLDRTLISPVELLCVSAWKPHELTQQFIVDAVNNPPAVANRNLHLADWGQSATLGNANAASAALLYRAFGLLQVRDRMHGMPFGGRLPGRININTIYESRVIQALADRNAGNLFPAGDVVSAWNNIQNSRSRLIAGGGAVWRPVSPLLNGLGDRVMLTAPSFVNAGDSQFPNGENAQMSPLGSSFFTNNAQTHPYLRNEMLTKIMNNLTTRSNTFAIWCTIGYFEVTNPGPYTAANRPKLGAELDLDVGANIRHKFFSIVDRTNLTIDPIDPRNNQPINPVSPPPFLRQGVPPVFLSYEPVPANPADLRSPDPDTMTQRNNIQIRVPAKTLSGGTLMGDYDGTVWKMTGGGTEYLQIGVGDNSEFAQITGVSFQGAGQGGTITVNFIGPNVRRHFRGEPMLLLGANGGANPVVGGALYKLGNPGPQPSFDYRDRRYSGVVRFVAEVTR